MPVIEVEVVSDESLPSGLARELAADLALVLGDRPDGTWVRLRRLEASSYAEGDGGPPPGVRPVFVTVLRADLPGDDALRDEARRVAAAVAVACRRPPENVHVMYQPPGRGRAAFGGELLG